MYLLVDIKTLGNNTAINVGVLTSFTDPDFKYPGVESPNHMVTIFLVFGETSVLFSTAATRVRVPANSTEGLQLFHETANTQCLGFLLTAIPAGVGRSHRGLGLHLPDGE